MPLWKDCHNFTMSPDVTAQTHENKSAGIMWLCAITQNVRATAVFSKQLLQTLCGAAVQCA